MENEQIVDIQHFQDHTGDDADNTALMIDLFIEQAKNYQSELIQSYEHDDDDEWHDVAHKLKGMAAFAGAKILQQSCLEAQNNYEATKSIKQGLLDLVKKDISETIIFFENYKGEKK